MSVASFEVQDGIGVIAIDSPPVNALGIAVRRAVVDHVAAALADDDVRAIVLICEGRTFFAGADITEFGRPAEQPDLLVVIDTLEASTKPVVAAMHGTALGGGLEVALGCHYRVAVPSTKLGLPEVALGLLPGAGGTQRLPRITGAAIALDLITSGRSIGAAEAKDLGILDAVVPEGRLREEAVAFAARLVAQGAPLRRVRDLEDKLADDRGKPELFADFRRRHGRAFRGFKAPENIIKAIEAAVTLPYDEGRQREAALFEELVYSPESEAQRHLFFAERKAAKVPGLPASRPPELQSVGVIGAGTMGGGIAMNFLNVGIPVVIVEQNEAALERGLATIRRNYEASARKGRLSGEAVEQRLALLRPSLSIDALADCALVIEAVYESMDVKREIFSALDRVARRDAILASNTSFLDLDEIARATSRPGQVVGLHFFSPANVMRLLEIVRGARTSPEVLAAALAIARRIGKVPVVSGVCHGFIANRMMSRRAEQADAIVLEGAVPAEVDRVMFEFGFPMGPFRMLDLVGLDVIGRDSPTRTVQSDLVARGRLGQKSGGGYYDYDAERKATPSADAIETIRALARDLAIPQRGFSDAEIVARLLYPVVNEGARILEEGIALRASDIDVAIVLGYGWPAYRGGPMFWADQLGLGTIVDGLRELESEYGAAFRPSAKLVDLAGRGARFSDE